MQGVSASSLLDLLVSRAILTFCAPMLSCVQKFTGFALKVGADLANSVKKDAEKKLAESAAEAQAQVRRWTMSRLKYLSSLHHSATPSAS